MSTPVTSRDDEEKGGMTPETLEHAETIDVGGEVNDIAAEDDVLVKKMALINNALDEIGMTPFQWKLFFLNGFGYASDSVLISCFFISQKAVTQEFGNPGGSIQGIAIASQIGLIVGAVAWGFSADIIGRRLAFNSSLFVCSIGVLVAAGMPSYISFASMVAIYTAAVGGNFILDATGFLEFLPTTHSWLVTLMAIWISMGFTIAGLIAWPLMSHYSCAPTLPTSECNSSNNRGWRYLHLTAGSLILVLSLLRILVVRMVQTPRWLISQNRDSEVHMNLHLLSQKYSRPFTLTLATLQSQGRVRNTSLAAWSPPRLRAHLTELFTNRLLAYSTTLIALTWFISGIVQTIYFLFLPYYLATRGQNPSSPNSNYITWRNYAINSVVGLFGPITATFLIQKRSIGRRGTLAIGSFIIMILQFAYTQIRTPAQNLGVSAAITMAMGMYMGTMLAYTAEILPSAHRATGFAIGIVLSRAGGFIGVVIASYANVKTTKPLFVCSGMYGLLVVLSLMLPFEPRGRKAV